MDKETNKDIWQVLGYAFLIILLAVLGNLFVGCSPRVVPPSGVRDSVRVEIRERLIHDSVYFEVPVIKEKNVTADTSSHLENQFASSDAVVENGLLHHSLETRPQKIYVPYEVPVHDTTYVEKKAETIVKEVPAQFSKWQAFLLVVGNVFVWLILGWMVFTAYKVIVKYK